MIRILAAVCAACLTGGALAAPAAPATAPLPARAASALPGQDITVCTQAPAADWMEEADFRAIVARRGFRILKFKVSRGNCYEIYGFDAGGQLVEVYFNPQNGRIVRQNRAAAP